MPEFIARVGTAGGDVSEKPFAAASAEALRRELEEKGFHVFSIRAPGLLTRALEWLPFAGGRVGAEEFLIFNQQLAALLKAGVPLLGALDALCERRQSGKLGGLLREIRDDVKGGSSLSAAFASRGAWFPSIYPATLASGEQSGELATVISRFVKTSKAGLKLRARVVSAFIYPAFILFIAAAAGALILIKVLPTFTDFFAQSGTQLPAITRSMIALSDLLRAGWWLLPGVAFGLWLLLKRVAASERGGRLIARIALALPLFGSLLRRYGLAQHARTLAQLLSGGMPLADANQVAARALGNWLLRDRLGSISDRIREGKPYWEATVETGVSTDLAIEMIKVGEASGSLAPMLQEVSEYYDAELEEAITRMLAILEPLLLVCCALIVAVMLIAIYLPLLTAASAGPN